MGENVSIEQVVAAVRRAAGDPREAVLLHGPSFDGNEWRYVKNCIDTAWVSAGSYSGEFERRLAEFTGARHATVTVNGTTALHMALMLVGVEPGTEVLVPALTFVATANAVVHAGAVPHFCDVEERALGLDAGKLADHLARTAESRGGQCVNRQTGRRIMAVVPMHTFGHPVNIAPLLALAEQWNLPVIEDAAESVGSYYHGRHTGTFGRLGILSFNGNKIVTTGGGGAILTDDDALAQRAVHLTTTAKLPHTWEFLHDHVGYNYRMPNINAALGCAQMEQLPGFLQRKRQLAERYRRELGAIRGLTVLAEPDGCHSNYWLNAILLDRPDMALRDQLLQALNDAGLQSRPVWRPMHQLPMYTTCPRMDLAVTETLAARIVAVPSGVGLCAAPPSQHGTI